MTLIGSHILLEHSLDLTTIFFLDGQVVYEALDEQEAKRIRGLIENILSITSNSQIGCETE